MKIRTLAGGKPMFGIQMHAHTSWGTLFWKHTCSTCYTSVLQWSTWGLLCLFSHIPLLIVLYANNVNIMMTLSKAGAPGILYHCCIAIHNTVHTIHSGITQMYIITHLKGNTEHFWRPCTNAQGHTCKIHSPNSGHVPPLSTLGYRIAIVSYLYSENPPGECHKKTLEIARMVCWLLVRHWGSDENCWKSTLLSKFEGSVTVPSRHVT